jgi:hypothetical protein
LIISSLTVFRSGSKLMELISLFFYRQPLSELRALDLVSLLNLVHQEVVGCVKDESPCEDIYFQT